VQDANGLNWTYLPYGPFKQQTDFNAWFEQTCLSDDPLFHVIHDTTSNDAIGLASLMRVNPPAGTIEVGHVHFSPLLQRTPMATEAMYLMKRAVKKCCTTIGIHLRRHFPAGANLQAT